METLISMCMCVCVCLSDCSTVIPNFVKPDGQRTKRPTFERPFKKPGRVKEREGLTVTDRALCRRAGWGRWEGEGGDSCCPPTQTGLHAQLQKPGLTCRHRPRLRNITISHRIPCYHISHWTNGVSWRQHCAMPTDREPPDTDDMRQHLSDWTKYTATQTKHGEAEHVGSARVKGGEPAALTSQWRGVGERRKEGEG